MAPNTTNQKRRRLGDLFAPKPTVETTPVSNDGQHLPTAPGHDSSITASRQNTHITPIENTGQVPDVDVQRNLAVNERTGEVVDDDTGEVLTVTTTTVTTTKTETRRSRSPQPPPNGEAAVTQVQSAPPPTQQQFLDPSSALQPPSTASQSQASSETLAPRGGSIELSAEPQRNSATPNPWPLPQSGAAPPKSAMENLKAAAAGLQDARSTIKSTLNQDGIPIPRRNPARGKNRSGSGQQVPPVPPVPSYVESKSPASHGQSQWQAPWPEPEDETGENEGLRKRKSLSSMPASFSPESSGQVIGGREKSPRLFKRAKNKKVVAL